MTGREPRRAPLSRVPAVWWLTIAIAAVTAVIVAVPLRIGSGPQPVRALHWTVLIAAFAAAELLVVHAHFGRHSHSFSLGEVPLVLGLLFLAEPVQLVGAQVVGVGLVLVLHRRQQPLRLAFNVAQLALTTAVAALAFTGLARSTDALEARTWFALSAAIATTAIGGAVLVFVAIGLSERRFDGNRLAGVTLVAVVTALANGSLGLAGAALYQERPAAIAILIAPALVLFLAYRAYAAERRKQRSMDVLQRSAQTLSEPRPLDASIAGLLVMARAVFHADAAYCVLVGERAGDDRTYVLPTGSVTVRVDSAAGRLQAGPWQRALSGTVEALSGGRARGVRDAALLDHLGVADAMVAPLSHEDRVLGAIAIGNRLGDVSAFDGEDIRLLGLVARQLADRVEHDRLERSLAELAETERALTHRATHDALTGLANRELFQRRVEEAVTRGDERSAVVFIDLDDFKAINDRFGHATGDRVLCTVAERIARSIRSNDVAARLGGDEFGLLLEHVNGLAEAEEVATRTLAALTAPIIAGRTTLPVTASLGVSLAVASASAADVLEQADLAMYTAKTEGKSRVGIFRGTVAPTRGVPPSPQAIP